MNKKHLYQRFDRGRMAAMIRGHLGIARITQGEVARKLGIPATYFNGYLRRRIDLLPVDIVRVLKQLGIYEAAVGRPPGASEKGDVFKKEANEKNENGSIRASKSE